MSGKSWSVASLSQSHRRIALDADVLIYLVDAVEPQASKASEIVDAVDAGMVNASVSAVALAEVLVGPARSGDATRFELTAAELRDIGLDIVPVTARIAEDAAWLRGTGSAHLVDALHLAAARTVATAFVTNDRRIRSTSGLEVLYLDDLELTAEPEPG